MPNEGRIDQGTVNQESRTDNRGASYHHVGSVHNAPVIHNTVHQIDSAVHHVDREDPWLIEAISKLILGWLGEGRTLAIGLVSIALGGGSFVAPSYMTIPESALTPVTWLGILLITVGMFFIAAYKFKRKSTCPRCAEEYALKEQDGATAREVKTSEGPIREITRPYKCSNCGFQTNRTYTIEVETAD